MILVGPSEVTHCEKLAIVKPPALKTAVRYAIQEIQRGRSQYRSIRRKKWPVGDHENYDKIHGVSMGYNEPLYRGIYITSIYTTNDISISIYIYGILWDFF